jgi:CBS-domain-containing membrane protein
MKSVLAVLVGYLIFGASSVLLFLVAGIDPKQSPELGFRIWSTLYGISFALLGGYTAARIAGHKELWHASAVAIILALLAAISLIAQPSGSSIWSQIAALGFMVPAVILGGIVRSRQIKEKK